MHERAQVVTLAGSAEGAKANETVTIEAKECGGPPSARFSRRTRTPAVGWTLQIAPTITTTLRAVWKNARSAPVTVQDRAWVQLSIRPRTAKGFGFEVAVRSELQFWKRHVVIQRLDRSVGQWRDMRKVVLTETGAARGSPFVWSSAEFSTVVPRGRSSAPCSRFRRRGRAISPASATSSGPRAARRERGEQLVASGDNRPAGACKRRRVVRPGRVRAEHVVDVVDEA